jgi:hypothetical protein
MEERGIDGRSPVFAWDHDGLRHYLSLQRGSALSSRPEPDPKQESIRVRGQHESILNDLRLHGTLLPCRYGTVVCGWNALQEILQARTAEAAEGLKALALTIWWTVTVSALDARLIELQAHDTPEKRRAADRERSSFTSRPGSGRVDARTLKRILDKERRLAESIHHEIEPIADHSRVLSMVSPGSGSSRDWKVILKASYEIRSTILRRFQRLLTDLQYQHFLQELMISLAGDVEEMSLADDARGERTEG